MKRKFTKLIAALALLLFVAPPMVGWGQATVYTSNVTLPQSGTNVSSCNVKIGNDTFNATKLGKSGSGASANVTIPSGTTKLYVHCAAWNGKTSSLTLSTTASGVSISPSTAWSLTSDSGISGSGPTFTLATPGNASTLYFQEYTLTGVTSQISVKFEASGERAVFWGVNATSAPSTYTVTYNGNGSDGGEAVVDPNSPYQPNAIVTVLHNTFTKTGNEFFCWSDMQDGNAQGANMYDPDDTFTITANTTLYAQWTTKKYNVTMDVVNNVDLYAEYGTNEMIVEGETKGIDYGTELTLTADDLASGYALTWVVTDENDNDVTSQVLSGNTLTVPAYAITISATLEQMYDITVASGITNGTIQVSPSQAVAGTTVSITATPASGYQLGTLTATYVDGNNETQNLTITNNTFVMPAFNVTVNATFEVNHDINYDFHFNVMGSTDWGNSYEQHTQEYTEATVVFASASKQTSTITDIPVTKGDPVSIVMKGDYELAGVSFVCRQWGTKTQTITLHYSTDGGQTYTSTEITSSNFSIASNNLPNGTNAVKITFSSSSNQVGVQSATITLAGANHTITYNTDGNGTITATPNPAKVNQVVTVAVAPNTGYALNSLTAYKTGDATTTVNITNNQFTMPDYDVTVAATFAAACTLTYSVNGVTSTENYVQGSIVTLPVPTQNIPSGFQFLGWTNNENNVANLLTTYAMTGNATLYAVFGRINSVTLRKDNVPAAYADEETEVTVDGTRFGIYKVAHYNNNYIQIQSSGAYDGYIYNKDAFNNLLTIVATQSGTHRDATLKAGNTVNPSAGSVIAPSTNGNVDTYTIAGNYGYIFLQNLSNNALRYTSIVFNFSDPNGPRYTRVFLNKTAEDDITITGPSIVPSGSTLDMGSHSLGYAQGVSNLIIEDGGQLISHMGVQATMLKHITGTDFGSQANPTNAGYYLIASPLAVAPTAVNNMIVTTNGDYDLYAFDPTAEMEWQNYKSSNFTLALGKGYLYANSNTTTLEFAGQLNSGFAPTNLNYVAGDDLKSLNLVGNPFAHEYDFVVKQNSDAVDFNYLTLNAAGNGFITNNTEGNAAVTLDPMEAILVQAPGADYHFADPNAGDMPGIIDDGEIEGLLNISVSRNRGASVGSTAIIDNALVSFGNAPLMKKIRLNDNATELCMLQGGEEMAVVRAQGQGELPVSFKAAENGSYTLGVEVNNVEMNYLHLIDNMTGADVDLLATPSYSFEAKTTDYASRFRLVFSANSISEDADGDNAFAYFNGSSWTVSNIGEATLQVVDVMGRVLSSETLSGNAEVSINQPVGVYMLRLVSGDSVKVQKVVVR